MSRCVSCGAGARSKLPVKRAPLRGLEDDGPMKFGGIKVSKPGGGWHVGTRRSKDRVKNDCDGGAIYL